MSTTLQKHIESFLNGNIKEAKAKLKNRSHRELRQAYSDYTGTLEGRSATVFADYIKGDATFQEYCNSKSE